MGFKKLIMPLVRNLQHLLGEVIPVILSIKQNSHLHHRGMVAIMVIIILEIEMVIIIMETEGNLMVEIEVILMVGIEVILIIIIKVNLMGEIEEIQMEEIQMILMEGIEGNLITEIEERGLMEIEITTIIDLIIQKEAMDLKIVIMDRIPLVIIIIVLAKD